MPLTVKMGLPISVKEVKIVPHRHTQRPISQKIPDSVKLTIHTNYHQFVTKIEFSPPDYKIIIVIVDTQPMYKSFTRFLYPNLLSNVEWLLLLFPLSLCANYVEE